MTECDIGCLLVAFDDVSLPKDCACISSSNDVNVAARKPFFGDDALDDVGCEDEALTSPPLRDLYVSCTANLETMNLIDNFCKGLRHHHRKRRKIGCSCCHHRQ